MFGGGGDDRAAYRVAENIGAHDVYNGGAGIDTLTLNLTEAEWFSAAVQADIANYQAFQAAHTDPITGEADGDTFEFTAFDLDASEFESLEVNVDGIGALDPTDEVVTAVDDGQTDDENAVFTGNVLTNDDVPDLIASVALEGAAPTSGTLTFNADGSYSFDPGTDFDYLNDGETADVTFDYRVTDADGDSDVATVTLTMTGTNDGPTGPIIHDLNSGTEFTGVIGVAENFVFDVAQMTAGFNSPIDITNFTVGEDRMVFTNFEPGGIDLYSEYYFFDAIYFWGNDAGIQGWSLWGPNDNTLIVYQTTYNGTQVDLNFYDEFGVPEGNGFLFDLANSGDFDLAQDDSVPYETVALGDLASDDLFVFYAGDLIV